MPARHHVGLCWSQTFNSLKNEGYLGSQIPRNCNPQLCSEKIGSEVWYSEQQIEYEGNYSVLEKPVRNQLVQYRLSPEKWIKTLKVI